MTVDLSTMNLAELQRVIAKAEKRKKKIHRAEVVALRKRWRAEAKTKGLSFEEVAGLPKKSAVARAKAPPKYRNPADSSQVWSGRGRQPKWLQEALAGGKNLRAFEIW